MVSMVDSEFQNKMEQIYETVKYTIEKHSKPLENFDEDDV